MSLPRITEVDVSGSVITVHAEEYVYSASGIKKEEIVYSYSKKWKGDVRVPTYSYENFNSGVRVESSVTMLLGNNEQLKNSLQKISETKQVIDKKIKPLLNVLCGATIGLLDCVKRSTADGHDGPCPYYEFTAEGIHFHIYETTPAYDVYYRRFAEGAGIIYCEQQKEDLWQME